MKLLEINNLQKSFDGKTVLKDISMSVEKGEVVSILGPSGSGKSTLLRCATFLETMDSGELSYCEKKIVTTENGKAVYPSKSVMREAHSKFGLVFQNFNLFPHYNVLKNVSDAPISVMKRDKDEVLEESRKILAKVGLADKEKAYPCELSGGQQQRVSIARALITDPPIIMADEPTGNLDSKSGREIIDLLIDFIEDTEKVLLLVTHDNEIAQRAKRTIRITDGRIVSETKV